MNKGYLGIDVGSTTAKVVLFDEKQEIIFTAYRRHNADIQETILEIFKDIKKDIKKDLELQISVTGSAGMGLAEKMGLPFIQEVIASAEVVKVLYPEIRTLIDVGGEDTKLIFFKDGTTPDIRMNGSCAGGTGAFIDQIAALIDTPIEKLNDLAKDSRDIYPVASRCGVFAKTDVQNLLSREISHADIAASIFHAVAIQTINALSRGYDVEAKVLFSGGPLAFIPELREAFKRVLKITDEDIFIPERPELLPATGAALDAKENSKDSFILTSLIKKLGVKFVNIELTDRKDPLFKDETEYSSWLEKRQTKVPRISLKEFKKDPRAYLGIDSGSTTTKIVLTDRDGELVLDYYESNHGNHMGSVKNGLDYFYSELQKEGINPIILRSAVTGYGEDLIKTSFHLDDGVVETLAHFTAAKAFDNEVSFILDIGGQDMKAMYIKDGNIQSIELNEACSSGCGSFIETFATTLGYSTRDFADIACKAQAPADLGSRCTVFMNSKVKQFLKEGVSIADISAGLAYSVVKNSLYKVLKLRDNATLGEHIVVQGGTFQNPAIHRAFEEMLGQKVLSPSIPGLMGAYGAALMAKEIAELEDEGVSSFVGFENLDKIKDYDKKFLVCKGCENVCTITELRFKMEANPLLKEGAIIEGGKPKVKKFYTGNKCEKYFSNKGNEVTKGVSLIDYKLKLLFNRNRLAKKDNTLTIGIPRVLNMFENFPFWNTLFVESGFNVKLSAKSTMKLYEKGLGSVMSDNICFPAKIANGHVIDLIEKKVDRVFYPIIMYEHLEFKNGINSFNCPIVTGYPEVIGSAVNPFEKYNIPFDMPTISFKDNKLLKKATFKYLKSLGVKRVTFELAFRKALEEQQKFKKALLKRSKEIIEEAEENEAPLIMFAGRPYHIDPLLNHKMSQILSDLGIYAITEDSIPIKEDALKSVDVLTQWAYPNRIYNAAEWIVDHPQYEFVQINSFGCGPDAIVTDEIRAMLKTVNKVPNLIRVDEISSTGSVKLRLRTMAESMRIKIKSHKVVEQKERVLTKTFDHIDKDKLILIPELSKFYTVNSAKVFEILGYSAEMLPFPTDESVELGLKYANNEICYPSICVVGDVIKALNSGKYDLGKIAIGITQTGGQCRASSYLSLIKKAMIDAGYESIPVVAIATNGVSYNDQPGFDGFDSGAFLKKALLGIMYGDAIAKMYYSTAVKEVNKGECDRLVDKHIPTIQEALETDDINFITERLKEAVTDFNNVEIYDKEYPLVGIIGEIYIKYNDFGNRFLVKWLMEQGVEVRIPPLTDFFTQEILNIRFDRKSHIGKMDLDYFISFVFEYKIGGFLKKIDKEMKNFRFYYPDHSIQKLSDMGKEILSLVNQYGEGWLIPAEVSAFMEDGINNVISLQPFGCIANQVVSKGIEKKLKTKYPSLNMLFLDLDADTSEVNYFNRLHFLIKAAKDGTALPVKEIHGKTLKAKFAWTKRL